MRNPDSGLIARTQGPTSLSACASPLHRHLCLLCAAASILTGLCAPATCAALVNTPTHSLVWTHSLRVSLLSKEATPSPPPKLIVIDAGHQQRANLHKEPIGPGSRKKKPKVAGGTRGVATKKPESKLNLEVAKRLERELKKRGYKVVMIRRRQKVNIANSKRAKKANKRKAALFIRLHADASPRSATRGISTLIPKRNRWTKRIVKKSAKAGKLIQKALVKKTRAKNRGVTRRGDLSGFNWCKVPTVLVEMGFMTNRAEDRKLAKPRYQKKIAVGIANGVDAYLKPKKK